METEMLCFRLNAVHDMHAEIAQKAWVQHLVEMQARYELAFDAKCITCGKHTATTFINEDGVIATWCPDDGDFHNPPKSNVDEAKEKLLRAGWPHWSCANWNCTQEDIFPTKSFGIGLAQVMPSENSPLALEAMPEPPLNLGILRARTRQLSRLKLIKSQLLKPQTKFIVQWNEWETWKSHFMKRMHSLWTLTYRYHEKHVDWRTLQWLVDSKAGPCILKYDKMIFFMPTQWRHPLQKAFRISQLDALAWMQDADENSRTKLQMQMKTEDNMEAVKQILGQELGDALSTCLDAEDGFAHRTYWWPKSKIKTKHDFIHVKVCSKLFLDGGKWFRIRRNVPLKILAKEYLDEMKKAHASGMRGVPTQLLQHTLHGIPTFSLQFNRMRVGARDQCPWDHGMEDDDIITMSCDCRYGKLACDLFFRCKCASTDCVVPF